MRVKVQRDVPRSLCESCKHATIVVGERRRVVECELLCHSGPDGKGIITFEVRECSAWLDKNHPSLVELESIAWILRTDPKRNKIGFVPFKDLKKDEKGETPSPRLPGVEKYE